LAFWYCL